MQQAKNKKPGYFGEEEEAEPSMYFNTQSVFRPDKEILNSPSPSQLSSAFGTNYFGGQPAIGNMAMQQRNSMTGGPGVAQFQRNSSGHLTPTSLAPSFPIGLQQQHQQQASPNRNLMSSFSQRGFPNVGQPSASQALTAIQKRNNPISSAILSSGNNVMTNLAGGFAGMPGIRDSQPNLDLSEFPTLGNRSGMAPGPNPTIQPPNRTYVGMVSKPPQEQTPEFQIQQEDFPALHSTVQGGDLPTSSSTDSGSKVNYGGVRWLQQPATLGGAFDQGPKEGIRFPGDKNSSSGQPKKGIQTHQDGTVSNIPGGMVTDQFGMVGLLTFIRAAETDPNLVALAPGIDLTTLGLNLNSPENLYSTFQSPWADAPCRPQDIDFHVPSEYLTNIFIRDKLAPIKLNRYGEDLLFFLFYMNGGDMLQLAAAAELYNRDWRYHKEERVWITRAPGMEPAIKTNTYERGTYYFFDAQNWRKVAKEFHLEYDKLEERPHLPPTLHHNPSPAAMVAH
ncbi:CCR4-NOT transcription complex subunit 2 isoform X2 [Lingula anatina]|uniref:CCR4-NOT transcription complex subunit 2 n=1 Tax=Lingula anatina TaxID=7574 RepID=A0A1S3H6E6_LINAN|nr:CCR4-NOT transcription complex subunit 2 isoform X2 [Lingula anatina]|eukprot:XP_013381690.1 CCR4-NOT transcription complex subunit 2 isoform X2 [Lingula anatina]